MNQNHLRRQPEPPVPSAPPAWPRPQEASPAPRRIALVMALLAGLYAALNPPAAAPQRPGQAGLTQARSSPHLDLPVPTGAPTAD